MMHQADLFTLAAGPALSPAQAGRVSSPSLPVDPDARQDQRSGLPAARNSDPQTSHAAAESARDMALQHYDMIVTVLRVHGPAGKDGIARRTGLTGVAVARRMSELERLGRARTTGNLVESNSGRSEREWEAA